MNIARIATVVFAVEGAAMVTATQSTHEAELAERLGRGAGDKISAVLDAEKRSVPTKDRVIRRMVSPEEV